MLRGLIYTSRGDLNHYHAMGGYLCGEGSFYFPHLFMGPQITDFQAFVRIETGLFPGNSHLFPGGATVEEDDGFGILLQWFFPYFKITLIANSFALNSEGVLINGNDFFTFYTPLARRLEGIPAPRANYQLGFLTGEVRMRRTGDTSLLLRQQQGFMPRPIDMMLWSPENRFRAGQRISMPEFEAEVKEVLPDGRPRAVEFHFAKSLDSTAYVFMCLDNRIQVCRPPEIGKETILAGVWSGKR